MGPSFDAFMHLSGNLWYLVKGHPMRILILWLVHQVVYEFVESGENFDAPGNLIKKSRGSQHYQAFPCQIKNPGNSGLTLVRTSIKYAIAISRNEPIKRMSNHAECEIVPCIWRLFINHVDNQRV